MARVVVTDPADADSTKIVRDLTATAGERVADRYEADFDALYRRLERFPESGAPRPALGPSVRIGLVKPYVVVYRYIAADDLVLIIRISWAMEPKTSTRINSVTRAHHRGIPRDDEPLHLRSSL